MVFLLPYVRFQHTAARRRLGNTMQLRLHRLQFQHTAARRRLVQYLPHGCNDTLVSTHSRPKAAGQHTGLCPCRNVCFNTQPPEGGWGGDPTLKGGSRSFNTQPPEGGWLHQNKNIGWQNRFQHTAARRRLGVLFGKRAETMRVSTHSRPKAAGSYPLSM